MQPLRSGNAEDASRNSAGFQYFAGWLGEAEQVALMAEVMTVLAAAPFYRPAMPKSGKQFSVCMTNCGDLGWVSDQDGGYRYQAVHPRTGTAWPAMPQRLTALWHEVAGYRDPPQACLVNHYVAGARLGSHVDGDEEDRAAPVVSISLGDDAVFHIGGRHRTDRKQRFILKSGDVVVLGGASRLAYHGIDRILPATSTLLQAAGLPIGGRINLTLRRVTLSAAAAAAASGRLTKRQS